MEVQLDEKVTKIKKFIILEVLDKFHGKWFINSKNTAKLTWPFQEERKILNRLLAREIVQDDIHGMVSFKPYSDIRDGQKYKARKESPYISINNLVRKFKTSEERREYKADLLF